MRPSRTRWPRDRAAGLTPFAIAAVAGSTNTGSVDAIGELADVAEAEGLWLHVDAAYGGGARLSERDRDRVPDLDRADSVTVDPHKWFFQAYDIGGLLVRDGRTLSAVFGGRAPGVLPRRRERRAAGRRTTCATASHDDHDDQLNFYKLSFEGTRRWRALKLWMTWKHLGTPGFGRLIEANDDLAAYLAATLRRGRRLRGAARRCRSCRSSASATWPPGLTGEALDAHQDRLQAALEASGDGWLTTTRLRGATWLRAGIVNYLSTEDDIDRLLDTLRRLARQRLSDQSRRGWSLGSAMPPTLPRRDDVAASSASSTSRTWNASSPDARCGRPDRIPSMRSARPIPRPTLPSNRSGTSSQASAPSGSVANLAVEPVRVAEAQRPGRPVDLEMRHLAPDDIE